MQRTRPGVAAAIVAIALTAAAPAAAQGTSTTLAPAPTSAATTAPPTTSPTTAAPTTPATTLPPATTVPNSTTSSSQSTTSTTAVSPTTGGGVSGTTIAIIVAAVAAAALIVGLIVLLGRRRRHSQWSTSARIVAADGSALASAVERGLPLLRDPGTAAQVWADLNSRETRLRTRLRTLGVTASEERAQAATTRATQALEALQASIDTDRGLRIGPPAPTPEQLAYSEALLRQRAAELERAAEELETLAATS